MILDYTCRSVALYLTNVRGAVIVDLPGVHDSNAARAAVAAGYMKQCTGMYCIFVRCAPC
jgi:hypothetical protein